MDSKNKLILASGKSYETAYVTTAYSRLYIRLIGVTFSEVASSFEDPFETTQIIHGNTIYNGYTKLMGMTNEDGMIRIELRKE